VPHDGDDSELEEVAVRVRSVGADALLLEVDDPAGWFAELNRLRAAGELTAVEIVPGARTVLLDGVPDAAATGERLRGWTLPEAGADTAVAATVEVPVDFDGPDLDAVATRWHTDVRGVVDRLTATELQVAFCGFSPGFAYLAGLPDEFAVPRLATPRTRVPPGSVGLADLYAGIYPTASPGGWHLVGRTEITLFDPDHDPPALLSPGTPVRFIERASP
jgi:KipI family sensor histidine kinase inhibitor